MVWQERIAAALLGLVGVWAAREAMGYGLWRFGRPYAGLWPFIISVAMVVFAVLVIASTVDWQSVLHGVRKGANRSASPQEGRGAQSDGTAHEVQSSKGGIGDLAITFAGVLLFGLLMRKIGFVAGAFLLLVLIYAVVGKERWYVTLGFAVGSVAVAYVLFGIVLGIRLPMGDLFNGYF